MFKTCDAMFKTCDAMFKTCDARLDPFSFVIVFITVMSSINFLV